MGGMACSPPVSASDLSHQLTALDSPQTDILQGISSGDCRQTPLSMSQEHRETPTMYNSEPLMADLLESSARRYSNSLDLPVALPDSDIASMPLSQSQPAPLPGLVESPDPFLGETLPGNQPETAVPLYVPDYLQFPIQNQMIYSNPGHPIPNADFPAWLELSTAEVVSRQFAAQSIPSPETRIHTLRSRDLVERFFDLPETQQRYIIGRALGSQEASILELNQMDQSVLEACVSLAEMSIEAPHSKSPQSSLDNVVAALLTRVPYPRATGSSRGSRNGCQQWDCNWPNCTYNNKRHPNAVNHVYTHVRHKPYGCSRCAQRFHHKQDRTRHEGTRHPVSANTYQTGEGHHWVVVEHPYWCLAKTWL